MAETKTAAQAGPPIKALIIDDDAAHAETVADSLQRVGYDCSVATSGAGGSEMLERGDFEIVISDLRMGVNEVYFFTFAIGKKQGNNIVAVLAEKLEPEEFNSADPLKRLWRRIWDENIELF